MRIDPFAPQLLIDYNYFCRRHGHLDFGGFITLWHAADALIDAGVQEGYTFEELLTLVINAQDLEIELIRAAPENEPPCSENSPAGSGDELSPLVTMPTRYDKN